ncbi:MAG: HD-GYP domain-containing protein [Caldilineaceae bacterium]|nr:HD-GYP domain-containing protein [Caldilineaceae bacterium]
MLLPKHARIYICAIFAITLTAILYTFVNRLHSPASMSLWLLVVVITTFMRFAVTEGPQHRSYEASTIALFAGTLLLAEWQFVLVVLISFTLEWIQQRIANSTMLRAWYVQPFNMAKTILGGLSVYWLADLLTISRANLHTTASVNFILLAILTYVLVNQLLLAMWLLLVRGLSFWDTGMVRDSILVEIPLAMIGYIAVVLLQQSAILPLFMLAPIALIYQSFMIPKLQADAITRMEDVNRELVGANEEIQRLNDELFLTLAKIFDARDPYVGSHAAQVATYAVAIAQEMDLPPERVEIVRQSAYLHDIGKIAIPEAILHKPEKLTDAEYEFIKKHAEIGADFISTSHGLRHLAPFIRHHHERWDGRGYPDGLAGHEIPLEARILNVCDSIEAMASDRPYHKAMSTEQIVGEVINCVGTQFDPEVAKAFIRIAEREGQTLVINSARSVTKHTIHDILELEGLKLKRFAQIYGLASA